MLPSLIQGNRYPHVFLTNKHNNYVVPDQIPSLAGVAQRHRTIKETDRDYMVITDMPNFQANLFWKSEI
jgi:hypothetical protein